MRCRRRGPVGRHALGFVSLGYLATGSAVAGLTHMIVASVINGLIFSVIFRLISHLTLPEALLLLALVLGGAFLWARSRDRTRW
jgi:uncharacterized membrane protein YvlD (DUF360 family)